MKKIILSFFVIFVALIASTSNAFAQTKRLTEIEEYKLKLVETYFEQTEYKNAYNIILPMAYEGNFVAQYYLGEMYSKGFVVKKDLVKGLNWYHKSIISSLEYNLNSEIYPKTRIENYLKNSKKAIEEFIASCTKNCHRFENEISILDDKNLNITFSMTARASIGEYYYNLGTNENYKKSVKYFERNHSCPALFKLGKMYIEGIGVEIDKEKGMPLLERAVEYECGEYVSKYLGRPMKYFPMRSH